MNEPDSSRATPDPRGDMSREEIMTALFGHMVIQNTNMALMFLGQVPHPESGERMRDLEAARMFIDQLEMLETKTRGNLTPEESRLLQQSLTHLRMTFVHAVENPPKEGASQEEPESAQASTPPESTPAPAPATAESTPASDPEEPRKRFSKKF